MNNSILDEYINFSKACLKKYAKKIMGKKFNQDIFDKFLKAYIDARYYNASKAISNDFAYNVASAIRSQAEVLRKEFNPEKVELTFGAFKFLLYFDSAKECDSINKLIDEIETFRREKLQIVNDKKFRKDIFETVKDDLLYKKDFIDKFHVKNFEVNFTLTNIENVYNAEIESQLKFPRLYNPKSIEKIFNSKEIFEDRLIVEYSYVAVQVLMDVIGGNFSKIYLVSYAKELNNKKINLKKLLTVIDNDITKENVIIKINYSDFVNDKEGFYTKMRLGFRYAIIIDEEFKVNEESLSLLSLFKYIVVSKSSLYYDYFQTYENVINIR